MMCRAPRAGLVHEEETAEKMPNATSGVGRESTLQDACVAPHDSPRNCSLLLPPETPEMKAGDKASPEGAVSSDGLWIRRDVFEQARRKAKSDLVELESELMSIILAMEDAHSRSRLAMEEAHHHLKQQAKQDLVDLEQELMSVIQSMEREAQPEPFSVVSFCDPSENKTNASTTMQNGDSSDVASNDTSDCSHATTDRVVSSPSSYCSAAPAAAVGRSSPAVEKVCS